MTVSNFSFFPIQQIMLELLVYSNICGLIQHLGTANILALPTFGRRKQFGRCQHLGNANSLGTANSWAPPTFGAANMWAMPTRRYCQHWLFPNLDCPTFDLFLNIVFLYYSKLHFSHIIEKMIAFNQFCFKFIMFGKSDFRRDLICLEILSVRKYSKFFGMIYLSRHI